MPLPTLELADRDRNSVFAEIETYMEELNFIIVSKDFQRPWGGFLVIKESQAAHFADVFFPDVDLSALHMGGRLSPKILVVEPGKRLSWQYHRRRKEIWRVLFGTVGVITSFTDDEEDTGTLSPGQEIRLAVGQRHRLKGLKDWGVLAEMWLHSDSHFPSDENDIVRVQDDFGR